MTFLESFVTNIKQLKLENHSEIADLRGLRSDLSFEGGYQPKKECTRVSVVWHKLAVIIQG